MSKGLEELKRLAYENACCRCQYYIDNKCSNKYECVWKTIEKELKDYEDWSSFVKHYGDVKAEDLQRFIHNGWVYDQIGYKKDEALKIIKKKQVQINRLNCSHSAKQYNLYLLKEMHLTQEEYDLLKEVLA